jgi:hypothetical protein
MTTQTSPAPAGYAGAAVLGRPVATATEEAKLERIAAAFGLAAAVTILFNTLLAWVKDSYEPLNAFMKVLTGHHWITHGLADVILFALLGWLFLSRHTIERVSYGLVVGIAAAAVVAGAGLAGWFFLV